jgi:tetratricopeptide (TPR) repeat protein/cellulose biosynthesis protein BcsQ
MIFTFYSFKGGVGRSMALANIAEVFYSRGLKVLMIDFDLEAPGLERYFDVKNSVTQSADIPGRRGVIDVILSFLELQSLAPKLPPAASTDTGAQPAFPFSVEPLANFIVPIYDDPSRPGKLSLIPSGNRRKPDFAAYAKRVLDFDWASFYTEKDGERFFEWFRLELEREWDAVLIDSRTGVTELGGVCTHHLADAVISFVATNMQNLDGSAMMARSLANPKLVSEGRKGRPLQQLFVPSRVELSEEDKHDEFAARFNSQYGPYFPLGQTPEQGWFLDLRLMYVPAYAYMERVAVREPERASKADLILAFGRVAARMASMAGAGPIFEAWRPSSGILSNLPPRNLYFAGREDELKKIRALLPTGTPVAICGLGGIGKSALAVEYAYRYRAEYSATLFCPAGSEAEMERGCQELARMLSITNTAAHPRDAIRDWLGSNEKWLLILDNALDPSLVRSLLPRSLRGHVLFTTRSQQVIGLGAQPVAIESLSRESSTSFFEKRLGKHEWNDAERTAAIELADEVGAMPLALEQAASYIVNRGTRIQDYLTSFRRRGVGLLDQQVALSAGGESSVSAALASNLDEIEKKTDSADVLRLASVLASAPVPIFLLVLGAKGLGDRIHKALSSAGDDPLAIDELLDPLTSFSLIERNREAQAFSVHRLVADLVRARVEDIQIWQQRAVAALEAVFPQPTWENSAICASLIPHVLAVLPWAKNPTLRLKVAYYFALRGEYGRAEECLRDANISGEGPDALSSNQLLARVYSGQGRSKEAIPLLQRSIALAEKLGVGDGIHTSLLLDLAGSWANIGESARAERMYTAAHDEALKRNDIQIMILSLCGRARVLASRPEEAIQAATQAVAYAEKGDPNLQAAAYQTLSDTLIGGGHAMEPQTMRVVQTALSLSEKVYGLQHPSFAIALRSYAVVLHARGQEAESRDVYRRALEMIDHSLGPQSLAAQNFRDEYDRMFSKVSTPLETANKQAVEIRRPADKASEYAGASMPSATQAYIPAGDEKKSSRFLLIGVVIFLVVLAIGFYAMFSRNRQVPVPQPNTSNKDTTSGGATQNPEKSGPTPGQNAPSPRQWGVIISADETLEPTIKGGPSAEWEPVRAWRAGFKDVALFHRDKYFWTVIVEPDKQSAEKTLIQIRSKPPYTQWAGATVIHIRDWCPNTQFDRTFQVAEATMSLYNCEGSQ